MPPLGDYFGGDDEARGRAALVLALVLGNIILDRILRIAPLDQPAKARVDDGMSGALAAMPHTAGDTPMRRSPPD